MKRQNPGFLFILIFTLVFSTFGQTAKPTATPKPDESDDEVLKVSSRLVVVPVSVLDAAGQPVLGLKAQDFRVAEENKNQQIEQVSDAEKIPLEIVLLFDVSASTDAMFKFEQETAAKFLQEVMRDEDRTTIFTIGESPVLVQSRDKAENSVSKILTIQPTKQFTAFYDTVSFASEYLQKNALQKSRKVIIVISDGEDTNSVGVKKAFNEIYTSLGKQIDTITGEKLRTLLANKSDAIRATEQTKVLRVLQNSDAVFYSINPAGNSFQLNKISIKGQENLQRFADETGGTAFLPKKAADLTTIFRQLANELRAQYLVQYYSEAEFPNNKYVKLDVGLNNPNKFRLRARQGYFVKN